MSNPSGWNDQELWPKSIAACSRLKRAAAIAAVLALWTCSYPSFAAQHESAAISFSPTSLNLGNVSLGQSLQGTITITNTGTSSLTFSGIKMTGGNRGDFSQTNTCGTSLATNKSCAVTVTFTPLAVGVRSTSLSVTDNAPGSPQLVSIIGTGVAGDASLSAASLNFAGQAVGTTSAGQALTLTNSGNAALNVTSISVNGDFSENDNCTGSLAAGASCVINLFFTPTAVWGRGGSVVISDNAFSGTTQTVLLTGMGNSNAVAKLSPGSLSFSSTSVGKTSGTKTITLNNTGTDTLYLNNIVASGDFAQTNTCGSSVAASGSCTITVTFTPSASGTRSGFLTVNHTAPTFLQVSTLSGTGTTASSTVTISPRVTAVTPTQTMQFTAGGSGSSGGVTWSVDGVAGGNTSVGTISLNGLYTPPPTAGVHSITATSMSQTSQTATAPLTVTTYAGTFTQRNDNQRTGMNVQETVLTTGNVNQTQFGKLYSFPVDGYVYAQPLYVASVNIPGQGSHNVVYVATEYDSVYAFDADSGSATPLWHTSFVNASSGITPIPRADVETGNDITPWVGITSTPVIDPALNTLLVLARTKETTGNSTSYVTRLHALDITTGEEQDGSPVMVQGAVAGSGAGSTGGTLNFDPFRQHTRPGLLLLNGTVYGGWASLEDLGNYHGWVIGFDEGTFQPTIVWCSTPDGSDGGTWQGGGGIAADASGNLYFSTGNGTFDASTSGDDWGDSFLKATPAGGTLQIADSFTPYNQASLNSLDWDLGAGTVLLLPDQPGPAPHLAVFGGKGGTLYVANRDGLGGYSSTINQNLQTLPAAIGQVTEDGGNRGGGTYWQGQVYYGGSKDYLRQFSLYNGTLSTTPVVVGTKFYGYPGVAPVLSANGNTNGIVWLLQTDSYGNGGQVVLRAYDASKVTRELYNSKQNVNRDKAGPAVKFTVPTVANGKVFVGTQTEVDVYGLLP
jgi:hypothetical protein